MTTSTLDSCSVVQPGLISNLLGGSDGIVLDDLLAIYHSKFKSAGNSLILLARRRALPKSASAAKPALFYQPIGKKYFTLAVLGA